MGGGKKIGGRCWVRSNRFLLTLGDPLAFFHSAERADTMTSAKPRYNSQDHPSRSAVRY